jgi:UDP-N-acetylmuramoyl-tripeptide--D-alanyl-D-alanine ligase
VATRAEDIIKIDAGSVRLTLPPVLEGLAFGDVAIDSREVHPGDLFVALPGERTDGHQYVGAALKHGACAALVRRDWEPDADSALAPEKLIRVDEPLQTLQTLAAHHRARFELPVIGITGSVGKTSTKELVAAVLRQKYATLANVKSFNNEIGVPLTLLRLRTEHQAAVMELGTYGPGEIALLCALACPAIGIVTNVGPSHLERMGTFDTVARAKSELPAALPSDGVALLNGDDPRVRAMQQITDARTVFYGMDQGNDLRADAITSRGLAGLSFILSSEGEQRQIELPLPGRHNVYTALAAIGTARALGMDWDLIQAGLNDATAQARLIRRQAFNGATVLDDTYNASPASCRAALDLLSELPGRHIAVFGDMAELGPLEVEGHRAVGSAAAPLVDLLIVVGGKARLIGEAALEAQDRPEVLFASSNAEASALLRNCLRPDDVVLIKGARVAATEEIVAALLEHA